MLLYFSGNRINRRRDLQKNRPNLDRAQNNESRDDAYMTNLCECCFPRSKLFDNIVFAHFVVISGSVHSYDNAIYAQEVVQQNVEAGRHDALQIESKFISFLPGDRSFQFSHVQFSLSTSQCHGHATHLRTASAHDRTEFVLCAST